MNIDANGDVQGNYTVLQTSFKTIAKSKERSLRNILDASLKETKVSSLVLDQVGTFQFDDSNNQTIFIPDGVKWVRPGHVPLDEPPCGFDDKSCYKSETQIREIITAILIAIFVATIIVVAIVYRSWKYEQEIDGLLWKISNEDILFDEDKRLLSTSRISIMSNNSFAQNRLNGWDIGTDVMQAQYKGALVALKEFRFGKTKKGSINSPFDYLSRENKKEMKLMKEMHHKNINPLIGVCCHSQHPASIFVVSEYCSKGSLRDIAQNSDIKLEEEFISSLIHDILSGKFFYFEKKDLQQTTRIIQTNWYLKSTLNKKKKSTDTTIFKTSGVPSLYERKPNTLMITGNNIDWILSIGFPSCRIH